MKFLSMLALAGCASLAIIVSTALYSCNNEAKAEQTEEEHTTFEVVKKEKVYSLTIVKDKDTFEFNYVRPDLYEALKAGTHLYIYDVYSPKEKNYYNTWSEKALTYGSWEVIEGDTVKVKGLVYCQ